MSNLAYKQIQREEQRTVHTVRHRVRKKITRAEKCLIAFIVVAVMLVATFMVTNYANMYAQDKEITSIQTTISEQQQINDGLGHQVSELSDPERILQIAQENGMELNAANVEVIKQNQ